MIYAWLIVLVYPLAIYFVPDPLVLRIAYRRARAGEKGPLPPKLMAASERRGRWFIFIRLATAAVLIVVWMQISGFEISALGLRTSRTLTMCLMGVLAGVLVVGARMGYQSLSSHVRREPLSHPLSRGPAWIWTLTFLVAGAVEEPWRAMSLQALVDAGYNSLFAVLLTSIAFMFARLSGIPGRIPGTVREGFWEALTGAALAALFLTTRTVFAPYIAGLIFNVANLYLVRPVAQPLGL
jgi:hypothetical protein